ncbi:hypothetical protein BD311DRAFT_652332 [Dichomitus squalens]|uniref:Uncharacterized protein n=1 Tax=Dichomitus squalens TaxID=114155 RepID=A0A4Q9N3Z7_9APHY|nr:hypothetical protein BD311DRAFT_652332 [Dichomitus squalens]
MRVRAQDAEGKATRAGMEVCVTLSEQQGLDLDPVRCAVDARNCTEFQSVQPLFASASSRKTWRAAAAQAEALAAVMAKLPAPARPAGNQQEPPALDGRPMNDALHSSAAGYCTGCAGGRDL